MKKLSQEMKIFLMFFVLFCYFSRWTSWNESSRLTLILSIVDENRFEIDTYANWTGDISNYNRHYYTDKEPGSSLLAIPIYTSWKYVYGLVFGEIDIDKDIGSGFGLYKPDTSMFILISMSLITLFTSSLFSALTVLIIYKMSYFFTKIKSHNLLIALTYGLGTLAFPQALKFTGHSLETFFGTLSFYLILKTVKDKTNGKLIFLSGISLGISIVMAYSITVLITGCCIFYLILTNKKKVPLILMGIVIGILPLLIYNHSIFENPFEMTTGTEYVRDYPIPSSLKDYFSEVKEGILLNKRPYDKILGQNIDALYIIPQILIFPSRGIFFYYPVLFLSILGIIYIRKTHAAEAIIIMVSLILSIIAIASQSIIWWGGSGVSIRYFLPIIPFLMIPLAKVLKKVNLKIVLPFLLFSILSNFLLLQQVEDKISTLENSVYKQKLHNFQVLSNPLIEHYLPLFIKNGPRSILFENLILYKKIDIRLTQHARKLTPAILHKFEIDLINFFPIGIVTLKIPFLSMVPISIFIIFIWKNEICKKIVLTNKQRLILKFLLSFSFIILFIRVRNFIYDENWYAPDWNGSNVDDYRWMGNNATIKIFNKDSKVKNKILSFSIEPYIRPNILKVYLNGKPIFEEVIEGKTLVQKQIEILPGVNQIKFSHIGNCVVPAEIDINNHDLRCLSFKIGKIQI